ncbi:MAG: Acetyltransferase, GNAT family [uncultured Chloroflexia bacterium]|uniref:Acetyltransferase, GNAT family n=1 Tax=uncultured Chloroflexia bacterium TaxID=1672391 RepID=A0A6J4IGS8_9CHLR|nr:MAG: Acetyltransferase, GNAT family [uncultured Chloroflexia bacterium]
MIRLKDLTPTDLAEAAVANLVAHAAWVQRRTPGMHVVDAHDLVLVDSGLPCDTFNIVCRARLARGTARERIADVVDYFARVGRPFSWWLSPLDQPSELGELLLDAGLQRAETELGMAADLDTLRAGGLSPGGLQIRRARTPAEVKDFATIIAANWTPPDPNALRFYELGAPALLDENAPLWLYVGYLGEVPVAAAELTVGGGVVGLYNISTLAAYRRRGFGTALTLRLLLDARAQGYGLAILQAQGSDGVGVYARLGFEPFGEITEYKPGNYAAGTDT